MAYQNINIGSAANDGTGDPLRTAFDKINDNFTEIYDTLGGPSASTLSDLYFQNSTITNRTTNGDITIDPNGTGKFIVNADFEVKGTTTQMNATTMQVEDNLVEFNRNSSGADIDAGLYINRGGAGNNAVFYWNEGDDKWKAVTSTSNASATSVTDTAKATIVANFEGETLQINSVSSLDSSVVTFSEGILCEGTLSANSIDTNSISSADSTAVTVEEDLHVVGTLSANTIDANKIINSDSVALETPALAVQGDVDATSITTSNINLKDSVRLVIGGATDVEGILRVSELESAGDSSQIRFSDSVYFNNNVRTNGNITIEAGTIYGVSDNLATSTTALSLAYTVHSLAAGEGGYTLADGAEGQIMYFTIAGDSSAVSSTAVTLSNVRNPIDGDVDASYKWYPFIMPGTTNADSTQGVRSLATAIFANGAWNVDFYPG
jgi:hypothetical protein